MEIWVCVLLVIAGLISGFYIGAYGCREAIRDKASKGECFFIGDTVFSLVETMFYLKLLEEMTQNAAKGDDGR